MQNKNQDQDHSKSDHQSGGMLGFLVVGLILAALLGGGIYLSKQQGRVASRNDTVSVSDSSSKDIASQTAQKDAGDSTNKATPAAPSGSSAQPSTPASPQPNAASTTGATVPLTGPSQIASTGPEAAIVPTIAMALLAATTISYRRSSAAVRTQALKQ